MSSLNGSGWKHMHRDIFVADEDAFDYAIEECVEVMVEGLREIEWTQEFRKMLVEWFYSDVWIRVN